MENKDKDSLAKFIMFVVDKHPDQLPVISNLYNEFMRIFTKDDEIKDVQENEKL